MKAVITYLPNISFSDGIFLNVIAAFRMETLINHAIGQRAVNFIHNSKLITNFKLIETENYYTYFNSYFRLFKFF